MTDDTPDNIVPRSIIMPNGRIATLWWPSRLPIPPGCTVAVVDDPHSRFTHAWDFTFPRSH
jgi:hypothetical protein